MSNVRYRMVWQPNMWVQIDQLTLKQKQQSDLRGVRYAFCAVHCCQYLLSIPPNGCLEELIASRIVRPYASAKHFGLSNILVIAFLVTTCQICRVSTTSGWFWLCETLQLIRGIRLERLAPPWWDVMWVGSPDEKTSTKAIWKIVSRTSFHDPTEESFGAVTTDQN